MRRTWNLSLQAAAMAALLLCLVGTVSAQTGQSSQGGQGSQSPPPAQPVDKSKTQDVAPLTLDVAPPVNAEEDAAFKAFQAMPQSDANKKIDAGEAFLQKYPESRYKSPVYGALTYAYVQIGQVQKMQEYGEKVLSAPPTKGFNSIAWYIPGVAFAIGLGIVVTLIRLWRQRDVARLASASGAPPIPHSAASELRDIQLQRARQQADRETEE